MRVTLGKPFWNDVEKRTAARTRIIELNAATRYLLFGNVILQGTCGSATASSIEERLRFDKAW
jgi:hypothetical protein